VPAKVSGGPGVSYTGICETRQERAVLAIGPDLSRSVSGRDQRPGQPGGLPTLATQFRPFGCCEERARVGLSRRLAPSAAPPCGGWIGHFGLEQANAEQSAMLMDSLDHVPVELELADDDGGKSIPPAGN
jgi:hypothetical protein